MIKVSISGTGANEFANELRDLLTKGGDLEGITINVRKEREKKAQAEAPASPAQSETNTTTQLDQTSGEESQS